MAQRIIQNIVGGIHRHEIAKVCQSYSLNMYPETVDPEESTTNKVLLSIKGTSVAAHMPEGFCRGLFRASRGNDGNPVLFGCWGQYVYLIKETYSGFDFFRIGQVSNALNEPVHFTETGGEGSAHPHQIANIRWIIEKAREFQRNIYFCFIDYAKAFDCVDHNKV